MKTRMIILALAITLFGWGAFAQDQSPRDRSQRGPQPPPQAYQDCRGKKAGDKVQHTTPEGVVTATCVDSPQGLVARPDQPRGGRQDAPSPQQEKHQEKR